MAGQQPWLVGQKCTTGLGTLLRLCVTLGLSGWLLDGLGTKGGRLNLYLSSPCVLEHHAIIRWGAVPLTCWRWTWGRTCKERKVNLSLHTHVHNNDKTNRPYREASKDETMLTVLNGGVCTGVITCVTERIQNASQPFTTLHLFPAPHSFACM